VTVPLFLKRLLVRTGLARYARAARRLSDGGAAYLHHFSDRVLAAPHREAAALAARFGPHGPDVIDLSLGAPRFDLLPSGSTKLPADLRGWPPPAGLPELRGAVAERLLCDHNLPVSPVDEVLITAGAAGAFNVALDALVNRGDRVVLFDPCSPLYRLALKQRAARIRWIPTQTEEGRLRFRLDHLERALGGAKLIVVNSPSNPTGGAIAPEDLEQIAWWADRRDVLIFSDEVFARYCYEGDPQSIGALPRARKRTLTAGSVSKGHGLASARVGWLAGPRPLVGVCTLTAGLQAALVPTLCQQLAVQALRQDSSAFASVRAGFEARRRYVFDRLQGIGLKPLWPAGGFFFWIPVPIGHRRGKAFAEALLRGKKVLLTPGEHFGPSGSAFVRLSYAAEDGRLREGLGRLAGFVRGTEYAAEPEPVEAAA
jgi:aspartate/methionine/tyrosine aminotransferase